MSVLIAVGDWDAELWRGRARALMPGRPIVLFSEAYDPASIRYALSWRHPPGALKGLANLQAIFSLGAGVDHLFADPDLPDSPIVRVVDADLRDRMSEWVVMHALMHLRRVKRYESRQRARLWLDDDDQPAAADVNIGVLGLGLLGLDAARKLQTMGFPVAGWRATPKPAPGVEAFHGAEGLEALLARTDILIALLPLTPRTRGLLNGALIGRLRQGGRLGGPILINAGRGGLQVEADILTALDSGALAGASLDVFENEPLPATSRLWDHPRVFVSPHNASMSSAETVAAAIVRQIEAYERGEPLHGLVDRARGY
jgi:glyoxylate/hydroxypyruvate reductase A